MYGHLVRAYANVSQRKNQLALPALAIPAAAARPPVTTPTDATPCTESHNTFSLLPDCLAARTPGTLDGVEAAINARQRNVFLRHLSNLLKGVRLRQSGPGMLDASSCGPRQRCSAPALRWRSPAWGASETSRERAVPAYAWRSATFPSDARTPVCGVSLLNVLFRQPVKECGGGRGVAGRLGEDLDHA